jgi:hypothetical protein
MMVVYKRMPDGRVRGKQWYKCNASVLRGEAGRKHIMGRKKIRHPRP